MCVGVRVMSLLRERERCLVAQLSFHSDATTFFVYYILLSHTFLSLSFPCEILLLDFAYVYVILFLWILHPIFPHGLRYLEPQTRPALLALMQLLWDRMEPSGWTSHISDDILPGCPHHTVIFHYASGDAQVFEWNGPLDAKNPATIELWLAGCV